MNEVVEEVTELQEQEDELIKTKEIIMDLEKQGIEKTTLRELGYLFIKRIFDIVCGLIGLICLIPLTILVKMISVCSGDHKSIFYTQKRIGKNGREFKLYKFRSMVPNADEILEQTLKMDKVRAEE